MQRDIIKIIFWVLLTLTVVTLAGLGLIDTHLKSLFAPLGIISFEVCAYSSSCAAILESWSAHSQLMAALSLGLDYLFMTLYPAVIFVGLLLMLPYVPHNLKTFTYCNAWLSWVAGIADAIENYHLSQMLLTSKVEAHAWPAAIAATIKFVFLTYVLTWLLVCYLAFVLFKLKRSSEP